MAEIYLLTFPYKRLVINVISLIVGLVLRRLCIKYGIFKMGREVPSVTVNKLTISYLRSVCNEGASRFLVL